MFKGDVTLVAGRPLSVTLLALAAAFLAYKAMAPFLGKKPALKVEEGKKL
jgi:hypothetical protein